MKKSLFLLWFIPVMLSGQRYISGRIIDAGDSESVPEESVTSRTAANVIAEDKHPSIYDFAGINRRFNEQLSIYPQEKLHLHTDRNFYVPGEKIWFKAYVTDAATHQYPTWSRYVYVELISPVDTLVNRVMIRPEEGMFYGYLPLTGIIPEGNYTLRAYTRYMENLGDDYFFKKNIRIGSILKEGGNGDSRLRGNDGRNNRENGKNRRDGIVGANLAFIRDDFDVSFFPEGGNLLEGVFCKVAFKALNSDGTSATITGEIIDENGLTVISIESLHAGMGAFGLIPAPGKQYRLKCRNSNGLEKQFDLPLPRPDAFALAVSQLHLDKKIAVEVRRSLNVPDMPCYLLAHCRGTVFYFSALNNVNELTVFSEEDLPAGVIHLILFDRQMNPLSERLVFNRCNASEPIEFQTDKAVYTAKDKVVATIKADTLSHFSISITDDHDVAPDSTTTILSSLLLSSELKGYIDNPAFYLRDDIKSMVALDYLMMTHGWRRYDVPEAVKGNMELPQIPYQTGYTFAGSVKSPVLSRPVTDSEVLILAEKEIGFTSTDGNGGFAFQDFEYPDSTSYFIQAFSSKGSRRVLLALNAESFPPLIYARQNPAEAISDSLVETKNGAGSDAFLVKAEQRSRFDEDMWTIALDEVMVTAPILRKEPRLEFWVNSSADRTIRRETIEQFSPLYVIDWLKFAGLMVNADGSLFIRGGVVYPLVFIDGIPVEWPEKEDLFTFTQAPYEQVSAFDVESVDIILPGPNASIFGARGTDGAISITTRRIEDFPVNRESDNTIIFTPLGYQKPAAFYSPKYETLQAKQSLIPDLRTTIFWKPDVVISEDNKEAFFEFYTSDFPTTYSVVIEGLTAEGKIVRQVKKIIVE